jgi:hypothetical protein
MSNFIDIGLDGLSVMVGIPAGRDFHPLTVKSLLATFTQCQKVNVPCDLGMVTGSAVIQWARDEVVDLFLKSDSNRLFWIDSDMVWTADDFLRLLALSKLYPVVCATYPAKIEQPTFFVNHDGDLKANAHGLIPVLGAGLGFCVMNREVVEALANAAPQIADEVSGNTMASLFRIDTVNGHRRGEDIAFFADIKAHGYPVMLDPHTDLGHLGGKKYTGSIRDALKL